ncbi:ubiquitin-like-specific protease 1D [Phragmites australis]|uniref:ubiquitin-like-specific protease 1D n=1 Tax=Phragmites australis TaxID=29695 RepID=UPI002D7939EE|nr:ubiquitin-like-specific protease 1D [Phragmites australis]
MRDSPTAELEAVRSSSSPVTPHPPTTARADTDDGSAGGDDGGAAEFAKLADKDLRDKINLWSGKAQGLLRTMPDAGEKMRRSVDRMKKELERRRVARQRKDDTLQRQAMQAMSTSDSGDDCFAFNPADEISDSMAGKYLKNSSCTSSTKTYIQVKGAQFSKESSPLSQGKHAYLKKDGRIAKTSATRRLKTHACHPKSTDREHINLNHDNIDSRKKLHLRNCTRNRQKNNTIDSKGIYSKLPLEDATFGSGRRWDLSKNKASSPFKLKKDVVLLDDDDDPEPARSVDVEISNKWDESKIYYPSRTDPEAVELTHSDMKCLEPEEYLKSPVINFCLQYLKKSRPRRDFYMFNTYFYSKLEEALSTMGDRDSQFSKLRRWWRSVDIFKKAYIILPVNAKMHWSLIIVCMPAKEIESGPIMLHLDSLVGLHSSQKLFDTVVSYLEAEWRHRQKDSSYDIPFSGRIWSRLPRNIYKEKVEVPRQKNDYDCGLFMLHYIDRFIQEAPERLTKEGLGMFGRKWFNHEEASGIRDGIRALLFDLFQSAQEDDGSSHPESHSEGEDMDVDTTMAITL